MLSPFNPVGNTGSNFICLTGFVRRRAQVDIFQRGTHRLVDRNGNVVAILRSDRVNLNNLEGQFVQVCGINEGQIEGVTSLLVTQVFAANVPSVTPPPPSQVDLRTLLILLLLTNPNLLRGINPGILFTLLLGTGLLGSNVSGLGQTQAGTSVSI